jgi:hypothetical protein
MHTHLKAKDAHIQVHHAHKSMAIQHEIYAMGLRTPLDRPHHAAAKKHREKAENHLVQAASHRSEAERHGTTGRVQSSFSRIAQSKHEGEKSIKNAQFLLRHGALLDSNMKAANEHRIAFTNHHEAGLLANALGHPGTTRYHVEQKTRHGYLAGVHAKLAKDNVKPTYTTLHTADEGIRHARASANDARHSNQIAHNSMQRTMVALPDSFWPRPAQ